MKLRVLILTEASFLSTGYAVYTREVLRRIHGHPNIELAELACYANSSEPRLKTIPWKVYPNLPSLGNKNEEEVYKSNPINVFGAWKFESVCLDYKPHVVLTIRDHWMDSFAVTSPYRKCYNLLMMVPADGYPLNRQWIADYAKADAISTYTDWGGQVLMNQTGGNIRYIGSTSPAADESFRPVEDKIAHKAKYGLENNIIIGTVMRNQKRKLFPDLFEVFRRLLDETGRNDLLLYCHTPYPDKNPWNIPELINEYGLASKVLMTYRCNNNLGREGCGYAFPSLFSDFIKVCPNCHRLNATTADVNNGVDNNFLSDLYNLMDVYVQYSCMEGFGMTQAEAAACGVPVMSVDYSGNSDVVRKVGGIPLKPLAFVKELETGRLMAVPDNLLAVKALMSYLNLSKEEKDNFAKQTRVTYLSNYGYDKTAIKYLKYFSTLNLEHCESLWRLPAYIRQIAQYDESKISQMSTAQYTKWLILEVLGDPSYLGSYFHSRLSKDLNYGCSTSAGGEFYFNDLSIFGDTELAKFDRKMAYDLCARMANHRNAWENERMRVVK